MRHGNCEILKWKQRKEAGLWSVLWRLETRLSGGCEDSLIRACLQGVMGRLYAPSAACSASAAARCGDFVFLAGEPCRTLLLHPAPGGLAIFVPLQEGWEAELAACFGEGVQQVERYATRKDTVFDRRRLEQLAALLPDDCVLRRMDGALYDRCLEQAWSESFVSSFSSKAHFLKDGLGIAVLKDGALAAGASSYARYLEGIEVEVDTRAEERRRHLAAAACAALILECLDRGLYPSWDAQNLISLRLAEKLGYVFSHAYTAYVLGESSISLAPASSLSG